MISRHYDALLLNEVMNDPLVRGDATGDAINHVDMTAAVGNHNNVLLMGEHGGVMFLKLLPGIFECHTQAVAAGRGKWIADFVRAAGDWMFTRTDAFEIVTRIPFHHRAAKMLACHAGMRPEFTEPDGCVWRGERMDINCYSYRLQDWLSGCDSFEDQGRHFHDFLHAEAKRLGVEDEPHGDQPTHNCYVGACLEMAKREQAAKGVAVYNRWALMSRQTTIQLLCLDPLAIKFDLGVLHIAKDGEMRVER